jgi:3-oxoacyl-[acyl-carrier protein] reductase
VTPAAGAPAGLAGRTAVVTGASRGLGRALALRLAQEGANVVVNYRADAVAAAEVVAAIHRMGREATMVQADVTAADDARALITAAAAQLGSVDVLVNNVGEFALGRVAETGAPRWRELLDSNLNSVHHLCHAAVPHMRRRQWGRIVNVGLSPVHLIRGAPNIAAYAVAKTGVVVLSRSLAVEEAAHGITVNCVSPGLIDNGYLPPAQRGWMEKRVPMGRLGRPEEIARAVAFLASPESSYISGANLTVSGAWDWEDRPTDYDSEVTSLFSGGPSADRADATETPNRE